MNPLLLLHGALGAKDQFEPIVNALDFDRKVFPLTLPGHGELAEGQITDFTIEVFAHYILQWMADNRHDQVDIFGYSMGGYIALWLALNHPNKVGKVMTLATKFSWSEEIAEKECRMLDADKIEVKVPAFAQQLASRHGRQDWKSVLAKTAGLMRLLGQNPLLSAPEMARIEQKVLVAVGDRDAMVTLDETIHAYKSLRNGSLLVLPETIHLLEKVNTARLSQEIKSFFDS